MPNLGLTEDSKKKFMSLACALSPENLCCDGEISMTEAKRRGRKLRAEWRALEAKVGRKVDEGEVWGFWPSVVERGK